MAFLLHELSASVIVRALDELPIAAFLVSRDRRFRWLNHTATELLGPVVGRPFPRAVAPEDINAARNALARTFLGEPVSDLLLTLIDRSGNRARMRVASAGLRDGRQIKGVVGLAYASSPVSARARSPQNETGANHGLTPRQFEVLVLLSHGLDTTAIAFRLGVAEETARNHIRGLLRELNVHSRLQAVVCGYRLGILPLEDSE